MTTGRYPANPVPVDHVEPVPRRVRAVLDGAPVLDTVAARYVWEWVGYPQFYFPLADLDTGLLVAEGRSERTSRGVVHRYGLRAADGVRAGAVRVLRESPIAALVDTARLDWAAVDAWYEEEEQVFVHPRSPYVRVDALRSSRHVRIELEGVVLAESSAPVLVFETGLPTRCYLDRSAVDLDGLEPSGTVTACPYKGRTSAYWSVRAAGRLHRDLAWSYDFPTRELAPVAGLVAFYDEKVDVFSDGTLLPRPVTHFS